MMRIFNNYGDHWRRMYELEVYGDAYTLETEDIFVAEQSTDMQDFEWTAAPAKYLQLKYLNNYGGQWRYFYELEFYNDGPLAGTTNKAVGVTANSDASTMWAVTNDTGDNDGAVSEITVSDGTQANYYQSAATTPTILDNDTVAIAGDADANNLVVGTEDAGVSALEKEGVFVSQINDFGTSNTEWGTVSWNATLGSQTMTVKARTDSNSDMSGATAWDSVDTITSGDDISSKTGVTDGHRYLQYRLDFTTTAYDENPSLQDITLNAGKLYGTHSIDFDGSAEAGWETIEWTVGDEPASTDIKFRFKTSDDDVVWTDWSSYVDTSPATLGEGGLSLADSRYLRIQTYLETEVNDTTPQVDDLTITFTQNGPPDLQNVTAAQGSDGIVDISYDMRDTDTLSGVVNPGFAEVSLQYWDGDSWEDCDTTTGEGLKAVQEVNYTTHTATWTATTDFASQYYADTVKIRVNADDNEIIYNTASAESSTFELDTTDPVPGATPITINSAATKTNTTAVTLTVSASDDTDLSMTFSNDGTTYGTVVDDDGDVTNSGTWEDYTTAKAWTLLAGSDGERTAYVQFRDAKGNTTAAQTDTITLDTTSTNIPDNVSIADSSDKGLERYWLTVGWDTVTAEDNPDFESYSVERSIDSTSYSEVASFSNLSTEAYVDTGLSATITYYYRLKTKDNIENYSDPSTVVFMQPASQDETPPDLSGEIPVSVCTENACTVGWTTDESATSCVEYGTDTNYGSIECELDFVLAHEIDIVSLTANTAYHYRVISKDADGNQATGTDNTMTTDTSSDDITPPNLSGEGPQVIPSSDSAQVTWVTDEAADSFVEFGETTDYGSIQGDPTMITNHSVIIIGLTPLNVYHYRVRSKDASQNETISQDYSFMTTVPIGSDIPPVISTISTQASGTSETSVIVSWSTDTYSTSQVLYGLSSDNLDQATEVDPILNKTHFVTITGLTANTTYYYEVKSVDTYDNETVSDVQSFTTAASPTAPVIDDTSISATAQDTTATIIWKTDQASSSIVEYGTTTSYGQEVGDTDEQVTTHTVELTSLSPSTTYHYRVKSDDGQGNTGISQDKTFVTTAGPTAPVIDDSSIKVTPKDATAVVVWKTDQASTSIVEYGLTTSYGKEVGDTDEQVTTHTVEIVGLSPDTTYHYRVKSDDGQGNTGTSTDKTFTTLSSPAISEVVVSDITLSSAIISWKTNTVATSILNYGASSDSLTSQIIDESLSATTNHVLRLTSLSSGTDYYFQVSGVDANGKTLSSDTYKFATIALPSISGISVSEITANTTKINYRTNVPTDTLVAIGEDTTYPTTQGTSDLVPEHEVVLIGLKPSTLYYFQVRARDQYGNQANSADQTLTTLADLAPPLIEKVTSETAVIGSGEESQVQAIFSWTTDEPATSQVFYNQGVSRLTEGRVNAFEAKTPEDDNLTRNHIVIISSLEPSQTYQYLVSSKDESDNIAYSDNLSILTPQARRSVLQIVLEALENTFAWAGKLRDVVR